MSLLTRINNSIDKLSVHKNPISPKAIVVYKINVNRAHLVKADKKRTLARQSNRLIRLHIWFCTHHIDNVNDYIYYLRRSRFAIILNSIVLKQRLLDVPSLCGGLSITSSPWKMSWILIGLLGLVDNRLINLGRWLDFIIAFVKYSTLEIEPIFLVLSKRVRIL